VRVAALNGATDWSAALEGVTHVVHLAAIAHVIGGNEDKIREMWEVNAEGPVRLAECAERAGVDRFVFLSSIGAVCSAADAPVAEAAVPAPDTPYGRSKLNAENGVARILEGSSTTWAIIRPALVHGPGNPGNMARLQRAIRLGLPLPFGLMGNKRSFVFVDNLIDAILLAMTREAAASRVFHVADPEVLSTRGLVELIARASGRPARLLRFPLRALRKFARTLDWTRALVGDRRRLASYSLERLCNSLVVDASAINRELGWTSRTTLEDALRRTLAGK
jgi:nucleoside-diphosphate-sugar epimerase